MKRTRFLLIAVFLLGSMMLTQVGSANPVLKYCRDRCYDFLDLFRLRLSAPKQAQGIGFHVRATCLAQIGVLYFSGEHFGMDRRAIGTWRENRMEGGLSLLYFTDVQNEMIWGNRFTDLGTSWSQVVERGIVRNNIYWDDGRHHPFSLGAELQVGLLPGIDVGLYPQEAIDFLVGFFTLDPSDDDLSRIEKLQARRERVPDVVFDMNYNAFEARLEPYTSP
jgi:hypothetical protein